MNVVCKRGRNYNAGAMQSNNHVFFSTSSSSDHDVNELSKLTRNELRDKLKEKGLSTNGLKAELVERLAATGGNIKVHPLVINPADDLDYEIYSSPQALHMKLNRKFHEIECEPITINNETWYTARYTTKYGDYPSGTFGTDFLKKINPDLVEEDCFTINGKNYYRSKEVALEAAAARVLDQLSFDRKRKFESLRDDDSLVPVRYCLEEPNTQRSPNFKATLVRYAFGLHIPINFLANWYKASTGENQTKDCFDVIDTFTDKRRKTWFTATFKDPKTSEVFPSGLVRPINVEEKEGHILSPPLGRASVRIKDGKVYYMEEKHAKHAAAARAIDCIAFREGRDEITKKYQLCLEEPYHDSIDRYSHRDDYDTLVTMRNQIQLDCNDNYVSKPKPPKTVKSIAKESSYLLHVPMNFLDTCYTKRTQERLSKDSYHCDHVMVGSKKWVTASFTDPATSEVFSSGLGRMIQVAKKQGATMSTPLGAAEVCIIDGRVYYADERAAMHAAAARAIDCYLHREGSDEETKKHQLCLEDPYFDSTERDSQHKNYDELLRRRKDTIDVESDPIDDMKSRRTKSPVSFTTMAKDFSFQLHVPMNFLDNCYRKRIQASLSKDSFDCDHVMVDGKKWVTASFADPATSEVFSSGLGRILNVAKKSGATLFVSLGEAEARIIDGKVYYTEQKLAIHAAAARAIDCYRYREETDNFPEKHQLCLEKPYLDTTEKNLQHDDYDELLRRRGDVVSEKKQDWLQQDWQSNATFTSEVKARPYKVHIPLSLLSLKGCIGEDQFTMEEVTCEGRRWLTATFKHEKTSETFSSGLCKRTNVERKQGAILSPSLEEVEKMIMDGKVYYPSSQLAKHAAAARAIDCYMFRETGNLPEFQICLETPHEEGYVPDVDYETLASSMENVFLRRSSDTSNCQPAGRDNDHVYLVEELHTPTDRENDHNYLPEDANTNLLEGMMPHLEEDDDNFHIVTPSFSDKPTKVDQQLSTLGRIAEIWAETSKPNRVNASAGMENSKSTSLCTSSPKDPTENIISWFKRVEHTPSNYEQAIAFRELCNKVLRALAKENSEKIVYTDCAVGCSDIHNEAKNILDKIKSISLQFPSEDEPIVNADTLNAYIQCLSQTRAQKSANVAEELLKRMIEGKDRLPPPNTDTYNAVMKLWSHVEGDTGKHGVNIIFSLLEKASGERGEIRPNRDTFQMLLSANSRENNNFKYDLAIESLQKIKELSEDLCGELFIPEADDYSAALTKPTGSYLTNDDENYYPSWIWHGHQYNGGFKTMGDDIKCEALEMEKWLEYAENKGTSPSEDMYLEVIRAWTNTGSLHGLVGFDGAHGAEELAKKAVLFSDGKPSVALFHPIIAAWSLCGENLGPDRVKDWIDQISSLGVKADLDLRVAYFVAAEKLQSKLISKIIEEGGKVASTDEDTESLFKAAQNCSRYLEEINLDKNKQEIYDLDAFTSILCHTMKAWSRASSTAVDTTQGVEEMAAVLKHISLRKSDRDSSIDETIMNAAGKVFTEFISQLGKLDASRKDHFEDIKTSVFADRIPDVESSLRSFEFHSRRLASIDKLSPESKMVRHNLYKETLRGCTGVKLSTDFGHVMRICALIMDCLSWHQNRSGGDRKDVEDITHIYSDIAIISGTCVENPYERMNVLTSIYDRASDFFPNKDSQDKNTTSYACVDRATLLGSMRRAMGDSEMTDSFLSSFEGKKDGHNRRRPRQRQPR